MSDESGHSHSENAPNERNMNLHQNANPASSGDNGSNSTLPPAGGSSTSPSADTASLPFAGVDDASRAFPTSQASETPGNTHSLDSSRPSAGSPNAPNTPLEPSFSFFDRLLDTALGRRAPEDSDGAGAIVITVNYMFMDNDAHTNPGRTGLLVVTLPNNATNREPRIIQQFISLATRMAYSALVQTPKKGVSLAKFNSFQKMQAEDDAMCAICFEKYTEPGADCEADADCEVATKKRKTSTAATATATSTNERPEAAPKYLADSTSDWTHMSVKMPCGHVFGQSCLASWLKENVSCPLCRVKVDEPEERAPPVSYFRFGGDLEASTTASPASATASAPSTAGAGSTESDTSSAEGATNVAGSAEPAASAAGTGPRAQLPSNLSSNLFDPTGILRQATLVIFSPRVATREPPPPPLSVQLPTEQERRARNTSATPVVDEILTFFGIQRPRRETPLFASGVSSRRTADGVETTTTAEDFESLTSLAGPHNTQDNDNDDNDGSGDADWSRHSV